MGRCQGSIGQRISIAGEAFPPRLGPADASHDSVQDETRDIDPQDHQQRCFGKLQSLRLRGDEHDRDGKQAQVQDQCPDQIPFRIEHGPDDPGPDAPFSVRQIQAVG